MGSIPDDAKWLICAELYHENREFVRPLWRVSRAWRAVAEAFVYRGLALVHHSDMMLIEDVVKLRQHKFAKKHLRHSRYIYITSPDMISGEENWKDDSKTLQTGIKRLSSSFSLTEPLAASSELSSRSNRSSEIGQRSWEPLIKLFPGFLHLTDVVIQLSGAMPPGMVAALEQSHPRCRLHLRNFMFRSLHEEVTDPDEHSLATSSILYSLSIQHRHRDAADHNEAAALCTVALAPNIKHVTMLGSRPANYRMPFLATRRRPAEPWKGFMPSIDEPNRPKTRLETLALIGYGNTLTHMRLVRWEEVTDLSALKTLSCSICSSSIFHHIFTYNTFASLNNLTLILKPSQRDNLSDWKLRIEEFFSSLNSLTSLNLSGFLHASLLLLIAERHGRTLKNLSLHHFSGFDMPSSTYRITANDLKMIAPLCPRVATLSLNMRRTMGDRTEMGCYEAIGMFQNLKSVNLDLDCSNGNASDLHPEPDWDEFEKTLPDDGGVIVAPRYYNGHIKRAIVNSALDESLARSIYDIASFRRTESTLDVLEVKTHGGGSFGSLSPGDLGIILKHVSRSYRVEKIFGEESGGVRITELKRKERERNDARERVRELSYAENHGKGSKIPEGGSWAVFKHIWPFHEHEDWRDVWTSWPLGYQKAR